MNNINQILLDTFEQQQDIILQDAQSAEKSIRIDAFNTFKKIGFPTKKNELWRYSNLADHVMPEFVMHLKASDNNIDQKDIFNCDVPNLNTLSITLLNGWYLQNEPLLHYLEKGIIIGSLREAFVKYPDIVSAYYAKNADYSTNALVAINTAFASDGLFIYIPDNVILEKPIQIINIVHNTDDLIIHQRNLIILGKNSQATVVFCDHSLFFNKSFVNSVTEATADENSHLFFYKIQNSSNNTSTFSSNHFSQKQNSSILSNTMTLHGGFVRNEQYGKFEGEHCNLDLLGLYITDRTQHIDNFTYINHAFPNCTSNEKYKGILDDESTGVFRGHVLVSPDAQKTNAYQSNKNILLSDSSKIHSLPQLEIYADDVKCSHGSTTGQLDEEALFYLRSRGIDFKEARLMLMYAFASEIINTINIEALRTRMDDQVYKRLRGELSRCNHCMIKCS